MVMKIYLKEANDSTSSWEDISERCVRPSIKLTEGFSTAGKTGDATGLSLTIKALNVTDAAAFHTTEKLVRLVIDGVQVFEGYSDGKATVDLGTSTSYVHVKVSFNSYMELLQDQTAPENGIAFEGKKIFDPADKTNSLVHLIAEKMFDLLPDPYHDIFASISDKVISETTATAITKTLPVVYIPEDETIFDVFQSLCYENGLSFYFKDKAIHILEPWNTERTATDCMITDFISKPTLKQQPLRHRSHMVLNLAEYTVETNSTVFDSGDPNSDEGNPQVIEPGESYPEDGEPESLDYGKADDEDAEIAYSVNPALSYTCVKVSDSAEDYDDWGTDPAPVKVTSKIKPTEGTVLFENENTYRIGIQRYRVTAEKAYWKKYTTKVKDSIKEGDEEEYNADYIPDTESAEAFVALYHLQEWASNAEIQLSTERLVFSPGTYIQVTDLPYKLLVLSRQTTYDNPDRPLYKYSMIPLVLIESPTDITHSSPGSGGNVLRYLFLEVSSVYYHYDSKGELAPSDQMIYATLTRVNITSTPEWTINGEKATAVEGNPDRLKIDPSHMDGRNFITVAVTCGRYKKSITITKIQDGAGGQPVQLWQYGEDADKRPDETYEVLVWGDLAITLNGWAFVTNPGEWETEVPTEHPEDKPYLWCKFWNYNINDWDYYLMNGTPAVDFSLTINPQTYSLTSRGYTKSGQTIRVICHRVNTNSLPTWQVSNNLSWEETEGGEGATDITIIIPSMAELPNFEVKCSIAAIGVTKSYIIGGVQEGVEEPIYIGVYPSIDEIPNTTTEGKLIYGDHALVEDSSGNRTPYYYTGTQWVIADGQMPTDLAWKVLMDSLYDATTSPGTLQSQSIINLFAQNFAAFNAFVYNLMVRNLLVGSGSATSGFRFEIYDYKNGQNVTPVIRAIYNGKVIFQIVPSTGRIFFGEPNSDLTEPETGFMYDPDDATYGACIRSKNSRFVIREDGSLRATSASVSGSITATSGSINGLNAYNLKISGDSEFEGTLNCNGLRVEPQPQTTTAYVNTSGLTGSQAAYIAKAIYDSIYTDGPSTQYINIGRLNGRIFKCSVSNASSENIAYLATYVLGSQWTKVIYIFFFDSELQPIPSSSLYYEMKFAGGMTGTTGTAFGLISMGEIFDSDDGAFSGLYIDGTIYINVIADFDNVYLNVQQQPTDEEIKQMAPGQLYIDADGFVKAALLQLPAT